MPSNAPCKAAAGFQMSLIQEMKMIVSGVIGDEQQANEIVYALIKRFGGERLYIQTNDYAARNREIIELHHAGAAVEKLATRYRISPRTVYRIIAASE
jgi:Mor family transcriptional regulator